MALQRCSACHAVQYPARELCRACLADALVWEACDDAGGSVLASTIIFHSNEPRFRPDLPLTIGLVRLDAGAVAVCFLTGCGPGDAVRVRARLDAAGVPVLEAQIAPVQSSSP